MYWPGSIGWPAIWVNAKNPVVPNCDSTCTGAAVSICVVAASLMSAPVALSRRRTLIVAGLNILIVAFQVCFAARCCSITSGEVESSVT